MAEDYRQLGRDAAALAGASHPIKSWFLEEIADVVSDVWGPAYERLRAALVLSIEESDFCYVCGSHPGSSGEGHAATCPLAP